MGPGIGPHTAVWLGCGLAILAVGGLVRARGRVDLLAVPTPTRDPAAPVVSTLVFVAGGVVVGYGLFELYAGFSPAALALCVSLVVALSFVAAIRTQSG
jgi:hypothetical protein